jgi:DNA-binding XRE family transcriptional regulator
MRISARDRRAIVKTGRALRRRRNERGWTQKVLARKVGVSVRTIGRWEVGTFAISLWHYQRIAKVLPQRRPLAVRTARSRSEPRRRGMLRVSTVQPVVVVRTLTTYERRMKELTDQQKMKGQTNAHASDGLDWRVKRLARQRRLAKQRRQKHEMWDKVWGGSGPQRKQRTPGAPVMRRPATSCAFELRPPRLPGSTSQ